MSDNIFTESCGVKQSFQNLDQSVGVSKMKSRLESLEYTQVCLVDLCCGGAFLEHTKQDLGDMPRTSRQEGLKLHTHVYRDTIFTLFDRLAEHSSNKIPPVMYEMVARAKNLQVKEQME